MKQLWCSVLIILLLTTAALFNVCYLKHFIGEVSQTLSDAQELAENGNPAASEKLTRQAQQDFDRHSFYLHVTLSHQNIDTIESSFEEVLEYLRRQETGAVYSAANSKLLTQLQLLTEAEQLTLKNIL